MVECIPATTPPPYPPIQFTPTHLCCSATILMSLKFQRQVHWTDGRTIAWTNYRTYGRLDAQTVEHMPLHVLISQWSYFAERLGLVWPCHALLWLSWLGWHAGWLPSSLGLLSWLWPLPIYPKPNQSPYVLSSVYTSHELFVIFAFQVWR